MNTPDNPTPEELEKLKWGQELAALIPEMGVPSKITPEIQAKLDEGHKKFGDSSCGFD